MGGGGLNTKKMCLNLTYDSHILRVQKLAFLIYALLSSYARFFFFEIPNFIFKINFKQKVLYT